jgi:sugar/nucleoside kinase (ribokinase family)
MIRLFAAGGVILDTVVAADGTLGPRTMGGNAVYSAAGARLWLGGVGIVARVPRNYPQDLLDRLAASGIDLAGLRVADEAVEEGEWFLYRPDGSRADGLYAPLDAPPPAEAGTRLSAEAVAALEAALRARPADAATFGSFRRRHPVRLADAPAAWAHARAVHLGANQPASQVAMVRALARDGRIVSLDPGPNAAALRVDGIDAVMRYASVFLPSEKELGELVPSAAGPADALRELRRAGPALLLAKLGTGGSLLLDDGQAPVALPAATVIARDPTGAGDAFCGGALAGLLLTGDPLLAACLGTVSASFAVESFGPFHLAETPRATARTRLAALLGKLPPSLRERLDIPRNLSDAA